MASTVRRAYADVANGQLHYRVAGEAGAPVLVFLHQSPSHSVMYETLMNALAGQFYVLAPDTPGFGGSDALADQDESIPAYAGAMTEFLAALGIQRCHLFGHHTGAAIAAEIAASNPDLVCSLAMSGPTLLTDAQKIALPGQAQSLQPVADGSHLQQMWQRIKGKDDDAPLSLVQREVLSALHCGDAYGASYLAVTQHDFEACLAAITCPALVFAGDSDPLFAAVAPSLAILVKGEGADLAGGEKTYVCERQSEQIASLLSEFFSRGAA
ncbi:MAG: alpha/beta hydrolase [Halieaceae bacterium]